MQRSLPFAQYWWKKCLETTANQAQAKADFCIVFAHRAFEQQDFIFAADGFALALLYDRSRRLNCFRVTYRYLFALLAFQDPNLDARNTRTDIAWKLAQSICSQQSIAHCRDRYGDEHFYLVRKLYFREFLKIYNVVFAWEDKPAQYISLWWKRCLRRRQETHQSSPTATPLADSTDRKKRQKKDASPTVRSRTLERVRSLRGSSKQLMRKANKAATRKSSSLLLLDDEERRSPSTTPFCSNNMSPTLAGEPSPHAFLRRRFAPNHFESSPTKRKLRTVR